MKNHMDLSWFYSRSQIAVYFSTRLSSLRPHKSKLRNPISILQELNRHQWLMFLCGFLARAWDSFDNYSVSMTVTELEKAFNADNKGISWSMTITMMLRPVGAIMTGICSDRYGRKWPLVLNLSFLVFLELVSGFCNTLPQFLGVRSLYGIAMGGVFGPAAATALEDLPYDARGVLSGCFELSSAMGNLLAAGMYCALVPTTSHGWRSLYWFGAGPPMLIIALRCWLPETRCFRAMKAEREAEAAELSAMEQAQSKSSLQAFISDTAKALKNNWVLLLYIVFLLAAIISCAHGSSDFFPTFLKDQAQLSTIKTTVITISGQLGGFVGGVITGYASSIMGRRLTMMTACVFGGALIPAYIMPRGMALAASTFFQQFFIGGVLGPVPIHLLELSPQAIRTLVVGVAYQLGSLASSATPTIQAIIVQRFPLPDGKNGMKRFNYGLAIAIFMGAGLALMVLFLVLGPEMSHEEREKEAEAAKQRDRMILDGLSLEQSIEKGSVLEGEMLETKLGEEGISGIKCIECAH
ncbi:carboxylic acid transporter [Talaromyces proteolyticus]|uniref:Carboxylic acid transporter n=1 Tax=Talaromyces proteolyticus TaxID=1131652 RepID=A0AAD4KH70_9EURO|nr:carboxylic acid transporter [Talaromyces proteolyticus]KAH8692268.1 carboxylic acid transporter [Talaromyces proteolyticus]